MWGNLNVGNIGVNVTGLVGAAIQNVQKISKDLESQLDAAVADSENVEKSSDVMRNQSEYSTISENVSHTTSIASDEIYSSVETTKAVNIARKKKKTAKKESLVKKLPSNSTDDQEFKNSSEIATVDQILQEEISLDKMSDILTAKKGDADTFNALINSTLDYSINKELISSDPSLIYDQQQKEDNILPRQNPNVDIEIHETEILKTNNDFLTNCDVLSPIINSSSTSQTINKDDYEVLFKKYTVETETFRKDILAFSQREKELKLQLLESQKNFEDKIRGNTNHYEKMLSDIKKEHSDILQASDNRHFQELQLSQSQHNQELQHEKERGLAEVASLTSQHTEELSSLKQQHTTLLKETKKKSKAALATQANELTSKYNEIIQDLEKKLNAALSTVTTTTTTLNISEVDSRVQDGTTCASVTNTNTAPAVLDTNIDSNEFTLASELLKLRVSQLESELSKAQIDYETLESSFQQLQQQILQQLPHEDVSRNDVLQEAANTTALLSTKIEELESMLVAKDEEISTCTHLLEDKHSELASLQDLLTERDNDLSSLQGIIRDKLQEISRHAEVIKDRERALENVTAKMSEGNQQLDNLNRKIADLNNEIKEKDTKMRQLQSSVAGDGELRKVIAKLQEEVREKDDKLSGYEHEGQVLAKKLGEVEKNAKKARSDLKEKETEIVKWKERQEQLVKTIEEMQEVMRKNEGDVSNASKSLSAMQAVSQATTDKLAKLEAEVAAKQDEINAQRRALDAAWTETSEQKRTSAELRAERDELKRRMGEGASKAQETESVRRDIEQREAVLKATNRQLQDSLQRQMADSNMREERLREELNELRKRWQDAITSRETLATEVSGATTPLLRQIASLQDSLRIKSENWQKLEITLSERAMRAESAAESSEHRRALLEDHLTEVKAQLASTSSRLHDLQEQQVALQGNIDRLRRSEGEAAEKLYDTEARLSAEQNQRQSLQASLRELEARHRSESQDSRQTAEAAHRQTELRIQQMRSELDRAREELEAERRKKGAGGRLRSQASSQSQSQPAKQSQEEEIPMDSGKKQSYPILPAALPSGETSFAALERLQLQLLQKEEDSRAVTLQKQQLQTARDALLEEVSYLSSRNAELEECIGATSALTEEVAEYKRQNEMLLALLGEKEEEVEAAMEDMREVKEMYKAQINELLTRLTGPNPSPTSSTNTTTPPFEGSKGVSRPASAAPLPLPPQRAETVTPIDLASKKR